MNIEAIWQIFDLVNAKATGYWRQVDPKTGKPARMLVLEQGEIVYAQSWMEGETLPQVLISTCFLTEEDVADVFQKRRPAEEVIRPSALRMAMQEIARKVVAALLKDTESLRFRPREIPEGSRLGLDTAAILLQGVLDASEGRLVLGLCGPKEQYVGTDLDGLKPLPIPPTLVPILPLMDGSRTLLEIVQRSGKNPAKIGGLIFTLWQLGRLRLETTPIIWTPVSAGETPAEEVLESEVLAQAEERRERMGLVKARMAGLTASKVAAEFGLEDESTDTRALVGEIVSFNFAAERPPLEDLDPRLSAFIEAIKPKPFPLVKVLIGVVVTVTAAMAVLLWFLNERLPVLRAGRRAAAVVKGDVPWDRSSRIHALQGGEFTTALVQGQKYLYRLQREDPEQISIRLGTAPTSKDIPMLLGILGDWSKEDVYLVPVEMEEQGTWYQVFVGTFKGSGEVPDPMKDAKAWMKSYESKAVEARTRLTPFKVISIPRAE